MPISVSSYIPAAGTREYFLVAAPDSAASLGDQLLNVFDLYTARISELNIGLESAIYLNLYTSDAMRCERSLQDSECFSQLNENNIVVSILELPPLFSNVVLFAYHAVFKPAILKERISLVNVKSEVVSFTRNSRRHFFLKGFSSVDSNSVKEQTRAIWGQVGSFCRDRSISFGNMVRTWIYIRGMDQNYTDMSDTRTDVFRQWGLDENSGFPASTGIGGGTANPEALVSLDAVILDDMKRGQLQKMEAPAHMSPTTAYGVTFERGLKVNYGDRGHMYISGTASIDSVGDVLYPGDLIGQTKRTLENIRALLNASDGTMDDVVYLIVYFRNVDGAKQADSYLKENLPSHIPYMLLKGTVCRPEWLIEIEGMAISKERHRQYRDF